MYSPSPVANKGLPTASTPGLIDLLDPTLHVQAETLLKRWTSAPSRKRKTVQNTTEKQK